ncbi:MAG: 4'-phosphopantetheinyl transferase family protein [Propionicimonas sp.]
MPLRGFLRTESKYPHEGTFKGGTFMGSTLGVVEIEVALPHQTAEMDGLPDPVQCWLLDVPTWASGRQEPAEAVLSSDELARAHRLVHPGDRERTAWRWAAVRTILSDVLGCPPQEIEFARTASGKPSIRRPVTDLHFSVAASGPMAMLAVGEHEMGVDLELIRDGFATPRAAAVFLTPAEFATWSELPSLERTEAFFRCWTRKEAWVKASGTGLGGDSIERRELCFRSVRGLVDFTPAVGHVAALAQLGEAQR